VLPGTCIGPYEIVAPLGVGGMGEVYRATDSRLKRQVAIKILPAALATDPDRLARFQREAEVLASLTHPHIAAVYGLEDAPRSKALVMELVEGATLAERIAHGPLPVDEALAIARQIAAALEAAHEQGIVHRDLKPANIKVRDDGTVKVLDFGLAKLADTGAARGTQKDSTCWCRATAMSPMRALRSLSRHRWMSVTTCGGTSAGLRPSARSRRFVPTHRGGCSNRSPANTTALRQSEAGTSAPDGERMLMLQRVASTDTPVTALQVVLNWAEELKRLVPEK
jgi:serine/threonine protein kinase